MEAEYIVPKGQLQLFDCFRTVRKDVSVIWEGLLSVEIKLTLNRLPLAIRKAMIF